MAQFLYESLAEQFRKNIERKIWPAGHKLPSIRQLSLTYQASKISIQTALQKLEAAGLVTAKVRSGYYVLQHTHPQQPEHNYTITQPKKVAVPDIFYQIMQKSAAFDIYPNAKTNTSTNHILTLNRHINRALRHHAGNNSLYYSPPQGNLELRQQISQHYLSRNLFIQPEQICITSGCQNALYLALNACTKAGDTVAIESPAFYGVLQILQQLELKVIEIPSSATQGILLDKLESVAKQWPLKALIVTPNFNTPTGSVIPEANKIKLCKLANQFNFNVIEDDIYGDLGFHRVALPLKAYDQFNKVILCSSFSKSLSRDLRIGWIISGQGLNKILHLKMLTQLSNSESIQQGLASFLKEGYYRKHILQYKQHLLNQRNHLIKLLNQNWDFSFKYTTPEGGLCLWLELPSGHNSIKLYNQALEKNITLTPGALFSTSPIFNHFIRLSFAHEYQAERMNALKQLGQIIKNKQS
ncbi:PLP-dependent aminotransferase family protein [Catenovulum sp. 2E275]|uniref:aminotransferase-like domain-containing protein n=1 Tax=Catenovulum sp. 2E275 TaxID=2980497 RepID=UPI0021D26C34|nr:PLP-dependent aminotransferase family protein [Catenovulum sp. 2E275]MCU4675253.1 PLP-dependent aminotransferase family protein [Catenovulum sp. 2E275]